MNDLKNIIKQLSSELEFCDIGFARAERLDDELKVFQTWLEAKRNAKMGFLENLPEKRFNPEMVLPGAKTIIMTAYNYNTDFRHETELGDKKKISRYGWGQDYHDVILPKLKIISAKIREIDTVSETKCYVDTGPVAEKIWAERAGIGWQGKHSIVISKQYGSWFSLGTIITTTGFEPDKPGINHCGTCTLCIDSCPTKAILSPKIVDAEKCISYWTTASKPVESVPEEIRSEDWAFGCDVCQQVCPWNRKPIFQTDTAFFPIDNETSLSPSTIDQMTEEEFRVRFKDSPIKRMKLAGIKRFF